VKKSLLVFCVALALSIGFTFLLLLMRAVFSVALQSNIAESLSVSTLINAFVDLLGLAVFFVVFYFMAKVNKISAVKSTITAMLLGVILGSAILYLVSMPIYRTTPIVYLNFAANSSLFNVFGLFLPALAALLFAELREKKIKYGLTV